MTANRLVQIVVLVLTAYLIFSVVWMLTQPARVVAPTPTRTRFPTYTPASTQVIVVVSSPTASPTVVPTATATATKRPAPTPTPDATATPTPTLRQHVVQAGDSMLGIAMRYQVEYGALLAANAIDDADVLYVGQVLTIPVAAPPPGTEERTHIVQAGETLLSIAVRYEVDYDALLQINGIFAPDLIYEGQTLIIPEE